MEDVEEVARGRSRSVEDRGDFGVFRWRRKLRRLVGKAERGTATEK